MLELTPSSDTFTIHQHLCWLSFRQLFFISTFFIKTQIYTSSYSSGTHTAFSSVFLQGCTSDLWETFFLSLASIRPPFWQIQVFLPEGRINVGALARVEHATGETWYQRAGEALESEEAHLLGSGEKHHHQHFHHPTRAPLTSLFLTQRRTELDLSLRTCNLNSFIPFRASFS